jgi:predicted transcriptional regulator
MTATVRIPEDKRDTLKIIASIEKRNTKEILSEPIDDYIERHKETLEILSHPDWAEAISEGLNASEKNETVKWRKKNPGNSPHKTGKI